MSRCLECSQLDLQRFKDHARVGFGACAALPVGSFVSLGRPACEKFQRAEDEVIAKRVIFDNKLGGRVKA